MIGLAKPETIPALKSLWREAFGDPEAYVEMFFAHRFQPGQALVCTEAGSVAAALYMLPLTLRVSGSERRGRYIYAVATASDFRRRGLSTALLEEAHRLLTEWGEDFSVLVPAGPALFDFYGSRGYDTGFWMEEIMLEPPGQAGEDLRLTPSPLDGLEEVRNAFFASASLYGCWDRQALAYAQRELQFQGGETLAFAAENGPGYAVCLPRGDILEIRELAGNDPLGAAGSLCRRYGVERCRFRLPAPEGRGRPYAMIRWYTHKPRAEGGSPWLGLVLD